MQVCGDDVKSTGDASPSNCVSKCFPENVYSLQGEQPPDDNLKIYGTTDEFETEKMYFCLTAFSAGTDLFLDF